MIKIPKVTLLHTPPLELVEVAARTAYDSFDKSKNETIKEFKQHKEIIHTDDFDESFIYGLAHTQFHTSILEHVHLTFYIEDVSRGVLQELVRHRMANYTVKSTRYTLSDFIKAYLWYDTHMTYDISYLDLLSKGFDELFVIESHHKMLDHKLQSLIDGVEILIYEYKDFKERVLSKEALEGLNSMDYNTFMKTKDKRNAGDILKVLVDDTFSTTVEMTINLRSLQNFFKLRDSGAAWSQIRTLAEEMKKVVPNKYYRVITGKDKDV